MCQFYVVDWDWVRRFGGLTGFNGVTVIKMIKADKSGWGRAGSTVDFHG